ncbi:hypothetical protein CPB86DRAFT_164512 [Serendipita vermifera]|nr:hypothetical protein CPB86DRAFT_164512 [Serendipita vermifera]
MHYRESRTKYQDSDNKTLQVFFSDKIEEIIKHSDTNQATLKHSSQGGVEYPPMRRVDPLQRNQNREEYQEIHQDVLLRATEDRDGHGDATVDTGDQDGIEELLRFDYIEAGGEALGHPLNEKQSDMANEIIEWSNDWDAKPIFNVVDTSASGTSILSRHLMRTWSREDLLIGRFFFSAPTSKTGKGLASTLARDIALSIPFLRQPILNARKRNANLETYTLQKQLEALVFTPLMALRKRSIIVIDALDQCCQVDRSTLLESLRRFFASHSPELNYLKIFLTCRPEQDILWKFGQKGYRRLVQQTNFSADLQVEVCLDDSRAPGADEHSGLSVAEHKADFRHQPQTTSDQELTDSSSMAKGLTEDDEPENGVGAQERLGNRYKGNEIATQIFSFEGGASNWFPEKDQGRRGGIAIGVCAMNGGRVFGTGNTFTIRGNSVAYTAVHGIGTEVNITNSNVVLEAFSQ